MHAGHKSEVYDMCQVVKENGPPADSVSEDQ